jgi:hypothetical protein
MALPHRGIERLLLATPERRTGEVNGRLKAPQILTLERRLTTLEHRADLGFGGLVDRDGCGGR